MKILEITEDNFIEYKAELIELNDDFLIDLNISKKRTANQKEEILKNMIRSTSPTHLLIGIDDEGKAVGMTYFNVGTGYSCGGDYIWMNSIYIRPEEQTKGYGSAFLNHVEKWARQNGAKLFISSRGIDNEKSNKLFERNGFEQSNNVSINKILDN